MADPQRPTVLVAEDDAAIRRLLVTALRRRNLAVDIAANGEEAMRQLELRTYAVLVLDLMMPKVNGWETIEWLRERPEHRPLSIVVVSAADRNLLTSLDPTIVNAVIFKPFDVFQLAGYVATIVQRQHPDRRRLRVVHA